MRRAVGFNLEGMEWDEKTKLCKQTEGGVTVCVSSSISAAFISAAYLFGNLMLLLDPRKETLADELQRMFCCGAPGEWCSLYKHQKKKGVFN